MRTLLKTTLVSAVFASALALGGAATASTVGPISDSLIVYDPTGAVFDARYEGEIGEDPGRIIASTVAVDPSQFGNPIVLVEPKTGLDSDIVGICTCGGDGVLALGFASDSETTPVSFGGFPDTRPEAGPVDVTKFLSPDLRDAGFKAIFTSDGDGVPEPATWAMMLVGFAGLGSVLRQRKTITA
jgi:hypothetical protein